MSIGVPVTIPLIPPKAVIALARSRIWVHASNELRAEGMLDTPPMANVEDHRNDRRVRTDLSL